MKGWLCNEPGAKDADLDNIALVECGRRPPKETGEVDSNAAAFKS